MSVVVATRNRADRLERALDAMGRQTFDDRWELIVVDDESSDTTPSTLSEREQRGDLPLRVIRRERAGGPGGARNTGWRSAKAPVVAFTDDDCEPTPGWLAAITVAAESGGDGCFAQGPTRPNPAERARLGPFSRTLEVTSLGPWFPMANMAYKRSLLERIGGFDESLPRGEDTDLAWRAKAVGAKPVWAESALVDHAVMELGPLGKLRLAAAWSPAVRVIATHPELRSELYGGVFWKRSHLLGLVAVAGAIATPWVMPALALAVPYVAEATALRPRALPWVPYQLAHDLTETVALALGSLRARTLVL